MGIAPGKVLTIVYCEVHVMQSMVSRSVYEPFYPVTCYHVPIMNQDGPDLNCTEEGHVKVFVHGTDKNKDAYFG
jgi:hypothetical protein